MIEKYVVDDKFLRSVVVLWQPKYTHNEAWVSCTDVRPHKNYIMFTCDRRYLDLYSFDGRKVLESCDRASNGKLMCFRIPMDWLTNEGELPQALLPVRERELNKYNKYRKK